MSNELSNTCEMIDIEQATAMMGYEPTRQEQILLSIIHERETAFSGALSKAQPSDKP